MPDKKTEPPSDNADSAEAKAKPKKPGFNDKFLRAPKVKPPPPKMMRGRGANRGR